MPEKVSFWGAIGRFFTFYWLRKALAINRAADEQFTGSVEGIAAAYDIEHDEMVVQYKGLRSAVSEVEMILEQDKVRLGELHESIEKEIARRDGALNLGEEAKAKGDLTKLQEHKDAFKAFDTEVTRLQAEEDELEAHIKENEENMEQYLRDLTKMQREINRLPEEKARMIATYVNSEKIIELSDRIRGIKTSMERGPLDAVRKHIAHRQAEAKVVRKLDGTDAEKKDEMYEQAGRSSVSGDKFEQMIAARAAERAAKSGEKPETATQEKADRPQM